MKIAIDKTRKRIIADNADRTVDYFCPVCHESVILKRGHIVSAHYAHKTSVCKDDWHHDMSEWHLSMQERFPEEQREIVVKNNGEIHRADILSENMVIEFQHSPISPDELLARNRFYTLAGYKIAWVFDLQDEYNSGNIELVKECLDSQKFEWSNPKSFMQFLPTSRKYDKNTNIYLYWINEYGYECFNRVIYTNKRMNKTDFSNFYVSIHSQKFLINSCKELSVERFFMTHDELLEEYINKCNVKYNLKVAYFKGYNECDYICPINGKFGLSERGKMKCFQCHSCLALDKYKKGCFSYCCYPKQAENIKTICSNENYKIPVY